jgi:hypothetical protein
MQQDLTAEARTPTRTPVLRTETCSARATLPAAAASLWDSAGQRSDGRDTRWDADQRPNQD